MAQEILTAVGPPILPPDGVIDGVATVADGDVMVMMLTAIPEFLAPLLIDIALMILLAVNENEPVYNLVKLLGTSSLGEFPLVV